MPPRKKSSAGGSARQALCGGIIANRSVREWVDGLERGDPLVRSAEVEALIADVRSNAKGTAQERMKAATEEGGVYSPANVARAIALRQRCSVKEGILESVARMATDNFLMKAYDFWINYTSVNRQTGEVASMQAVIDQNEQMFAADRQLCDERHSEELSALRETVAGIDARLEAARREGAEPLAALQRALEDARSAGRAAQEQAARALQDEAKKCRLRTMGTLVKLGAAREAAAGALKAKEAEVAALRAANEGVQDMRRAEKEESSRAMRNLMERIDSLNRDIEARKGAQENERVQLARLAEQLSRYKEQESSLREVLRTAQERVATAEAATVAARVAASAQAKEELATQLAAVRQSLKTSSVAEREEFQAQYSELEKRMEQMQKEHAARLAEMQQQVLNAEERAQAEILRLRGDNTAETLESMQKTEQRIRAAQEDFVRQSEERQKECVAKLKVMEMAATEKLDTFQRAAAARTADLEAALAESARQSMTFAEQMAEKQRDIEACKTSLQDANEQLARSKAFFDDLEAKIKERAARDIAEARQQGKFEGLQEGNAERGKLGAQLQAQFEAQVKQTTEGLLKQLADIRSTLADKEGRLAAAEARLSGAQRDTTRRSQEIVAQAERASRALQQQLSNIREAGRVVITGVQHVRRQAYFGTQGGAAAPAAGWSLADALPFVGSGDSAKLRELQEYTSALTKAIKEMLPTIDQLAALQPEDDLGRSKSFVISKGEGDPVRNPEFSPFYKLGAGP